MRVWRLLTAVGLAGLLAACGAGGLSLSGTIRLGTIFSLTGGAAGYGLAQRRGVELALDDINAAGLLAPATLAVEFADDGSTPAGAQQAMAAHLAAGRPAILGPTLSSAALQADPLAQAAGTPVLAVSNTAAGIVEIGDFIFRASLPESSVVPHTVAVTRARLGYTTAATFVDPTEPFSVGSHTAFLAALADAGVTVVATEEVSAADGGDFSAAIARVAAAAPEVLVVTPLVGLAAPLLVQLRAAGLTVPILGGNSFNTPELAAQAGAAAEGAISGAAWLASADTPGNAAFVAAYTARFGATPDQFAAQAYTGAWLLARAIAAAGSTERARLREALAGLRNVPTVLGEFSFDDTREPVHEPVVQVVRGGVFELF